MEFDGLHGRGHRLGVWVELLEKVLDVLDTEQTVHILEHLGLVGREERGEETFVSTPSALKLASSAGLAGATLDGHRVIITHSDRHRGIGSDRVAIAVVH